MDNIDTDLFSTSVRGGMFQPADQMLHRLRTSTYDLVRAAFDDCLARTALLQQAPCVGEFIKRALRWHATPEGHCCSSACCLVAQFIEAKMQGRRVSLAQPQMRSHQGI